ncbi:hypothetical protein [Dyadobacter alkalitolerans]|uniref:hypothetical protein n=1 Tax=Dyadobacter alkalitolerans TaxID=492736 RepID=UPI000479D05F|nr:hypothetical protein [Dyadobacter alkalitolerans]
MKKISFVQTFVLFLLFAALACKNDNPLIKDEPVVEVPAIPSENYLRVDDKYYPIDTASVWFSKIGNLTSFDISFYNADQFLQIGYLTFRNTKILKDGEFHYQPSKDLRAFEVDHFHNVSLLFGEKGKDLFLDGISGSQIKNGRIAIKKLGITTQIDALLEIDSKKIQVHYVGSLNIVEYW